MNEKVIITTAEVQAWQHELDKISMYRAVLIDELENSLIVADSRLLRDSQ